MTAHTKDRIPARFSPSVVGLIIGVILIVMGAVAMAGFMSGMEKSLPQDNSTLGNSFEKYKNRTNEITQHTQNIRDSTRIKQRTGDLDVIGSIFSSGYSALMISIKSFDLFDLMMVDMAEDVPVFATYKNLIMAIFLVLIMLGVVIAAMIKFNP